MGLGVSGRCSSRIGADSATCQSARPYDGRPPPQFMEIALNRRLPVGTVLILVAAAAAGSPGVATAATAICHGSAATIVGHGQDVLRGTSGRDVIVTRGVFEVRAGGGDDLICVTAGPDERSTGNVRAGAGDDEVWVDTTSRSDDVWVELGIGSDHLHGSVGAESVVAGVAISDDRLGPDDERDAEPDVIETGANHDMVFLGEQRAALGDRVDTGPGDDDVTVVADEMTPDAAIDLGSGHDRLSFWWPTSTTGSWVFDNRTGVGTLDGVAQLQWSSAEAFDLPEPHPNAVSFIGSDIAESVWAASFADIDLGGGDDYLSQNYSSAPEAATRIAAADGGPGRDKLDVDGSGIRVDLAAGQVRDPEKRDIDDVDIDGFEDVRADGGWRRVTVIGDDNDNRIEVGGCVAVVHAGAGDDRVYAVEVDRCRSASRAVLFGDDGDDLIIGGQTGDRLDGGTGRDRLSGRAGRDQADGGTGTDTCSAEVRTSCRPPARG